MDKDKIRRKKKEYNILYTMFQRYILEDYEKSKLLALLAECLLREICRQIGKFRICLIEAGSSSREHVRNGSYLTRGGNCHNTRAPPSCFPLFSLTLHFNEGRISVANGLLATGEKRERCNFSEKGRKEGERAIPTDHFFLFSLSLPPPLSPSEYKRVFSGFPRSELRASLFSTNLCGKGNNGIEKIRIDSLLRAKDRN